MSMPPKILVVENVPTELKRLDQWAAWQWELRDGKWTKPPLNPATGRYARNNDPGTWGSFDEALRRVRRDRLAGVGFMFHPEDGFAGVDLDKCRESETGEVKPWALEIVKKFNSYTEISPSGTGLKIFLCGKLPPGRRRKGSIEMYDQARFFTTTGHRMVGSSSSIRNCQEELTMLHRRVFGKPTACATDAEKGSHEGVVHGLSDTEILDRAMRATNGDKFKRLWAGDTSDYRTAYNEGRSEADLGLCSLLAFWCGPDKDQIDRLFRQSGLMRKKWERTDYRALTLAVALNRRAFWEGGGATAFEHGKFYARRKGVISVG